jgi:signal transduction histidine kinase
MSADDKVPHEDEAAREPERLSREQMLRASRLVAAGTLTAGLSHEIRNPLNGATLQLHVLERRLKGLDPALQPTLLAPLRQAREELTRLEHLLEDFLQFARARAVVARPVSLRTVMETVCSLVQGSADRVGVRLDLDLGSLPDALGDEELLRQVLMHLVLNAVEAMPDGGALKATGEVGPGWVQLVLDDTGPGVPHALRERVFEPFFTTKSAGTGLGLPLAHALLSQLGGSLALADAPGGGARLVVRLPTPG